MKKNDFTLCDVQDALYANDIDRKYAGSVRDAIKAEYGKDYYRYRSVAELRYANGITVLSRANIVSAVYPTATGYEDEFAQAYSIASPIVYVERSKKGQYQYVGLVRKF